ncbi:hypothetical protein [Candidatus Cardinium hertigii]|uniref:hypothetical protein n=1 Tax=Candidatus Cardinium hertigii TaxID=247481 RepID=UPI001613BAFD|nr:hypothetical protein [Candidatus Cardinium hertigii]
MFDYKTGMLCGIPQKKMYRYQWIGLIATSFGIGICLWLLFIHLPLGTEALFAQRSKAKALLLQSLDFNLSIVSLGCLFGWMLKKIKLNPSMVLGGLLMPNSITCGLLLGSLSTLIFKNKDKAQPICAGILAVEALWVIISIFSGMI